MNIDRLRTLVERAINTDAPLSQFDEGDLRITIRAVADARPTLAPAHAVRHGHSTIHSALFGLFHAQPGSDGPPFVRLGERVEAGQKIGLIEAMKVFSPIVAERAGRIVAVLAEHGAEVECGQALFHVE